MKKIMLFHFFQKLWKSCAVVTTLFICTAISIAFAEDAIKQAIVDYENELYKLSYSQKPEERADVIALLADIGSSHYFETRDRYLNDPAIEVKRALITAISEMGDDSENSRKFLTACLRSNDDYLVFHAYSSLNNLRKFSIDFKELWNPESPTILFGAYAPRNGIDYRRITGIAKAEPWKDPAWKHLWRGIQLSLLCRSGNPEALPLIEHLLTFKELKQGIWMFGAAELIDRDYMVKLLDHPNEIISNYACRSLLNANDEEYTQKVKKIAQEYIEAHDKTSFYKKTEMKNLYLILPYLDSNSLKRISVMPPQGTDLYQWFSNVHRELAKRGEPIALNELMLMEKQNLLSPPTVRLFKSEAIVREYAYELLPGYLQQISSLQEFDQYDRLSVLFHSINKSRSFHAGLPLTIAHQCFVLLKEWHASKSAEDYRLKLLGLLARGKDSDELWQQWKNSADPLNDKEKIIPVAWGFSKRSDQLRHIMIEYRHKRWFPSFIGDAFETFYVSANGRISCESQFAYVLQLQSNISIRTNSAYEIVNKFNIRLQQYFNPFNKEQYIKELLRTKGVSLSESDPDANLEFLNNPLFLIRKLVWEYSQDKISCMQSDLRGIYYFPESAEWLESNKKCRKFIKNKELGFPGADFSKSENDWMITLINAERKHYLKKILQQVYNPPSELIVCPGPVMGSSCPIARPPEELSGIGKFIPSAILLNNFDNDFLEDYSAFARSKDEKLKNAALWALWHLKRDEDAIKTWLKDAKGNNHDARYKALYILQYLRYRPAAFLYPQLLQDTDPVMRYLGLLGIHAFKMGEAKEKILKLLDDPNENIKGTAILTLGKLEINEARPILFNMLDEKGPTYYCAIVALKDFHDPQDIDYLLHQVNAAKITIDQTDALREIMQSYSNKYAPFIMLIPAKSGVWIFQDLVKSWNKWKKLREEHTYDKFIMAGYDDLVSKCLNELDTMQAGMACMKIKQLFPMLGDSTGDVQRYRSMLDSWWLAHKDGDPWEILTGYEMRTNEKIDLLLQLNENKTLRYLFSLFVNSCRYASGGYNSPSHQFFADYAGEDFGDPCQAYCAAKDKIIDDWLNWARGRNINP